MALEVMQAAEALFKEIKVTKTLSNENLVQLNFLFGQKAITALNILDRKTCTCIIAKPSGRRFYQVEGGTKNNPELHLCLKHYCSCSDFSFNVLVKRDELYCKHQLATIVGDLIGKVVIKEVTDAEYAKLLCAGDLPEGVS
jgi:hypothetical protein